MYICSLENSEVKARPLDVYITLVILLYILLSGPNLVLLYFLQVHVSDSSDVTEENAKRFVYDFLQKRLMGKKLVL